MRRNYPTDEPRLGYNPAVADIVLTTFNARYAHAAFGLRYLLANLGPLADSAIILEFDINQRHLDSLETILATSPKIVGMGVYIWNIESVHSAGGGPETRAARRDCRAGWAGS